MSKRLIAMFFCSIFFGSALGLIGTSGFALAETIGRFQCSVVGAVGEEPIGDRPGHFLANLQYSCFGVGGGVLKDVVHTASSISEWDALHGTFLIGGGIHLAPGGLAVTQITDGSGSVVLRDGKAVGTASSGTGVFKFASGSLLALKGKVFKFVTVPTEPNRFDMEFTD